MPSMSWCPMNRCGCPVPDPIAYIERTRRYYLALGYDTPYRWACNEEIPFTPLRKPLPDCTVAIVTTASLYDPANGDQGPGAAYNGQAKFFEPYAESVYGSADTRIAHIAYDRDHTSAEDQRTWFPLEALKAAANSGTIGAVAPRFHGLPTNRSVRLTLEDFAPKILTALREDRVDAAVLVPNCPVCHQSATLVARYLEERGLPTVVMGCARDIVESAGAPRFVFSDFPLGNAAGKPNDTISQAATLGLALDLLATAIQPTTIENPQEWSADNGWKADYSNPDRFTPEQLDALCEEFEAQKPRAVLAARS